MSGLMEAPQRDAGHENIGDQHRHARGFRRDAHERERGEITGRAAVADRRVKERDAENGGEQQADLNLRKAGHQTVRNWFRYTLSNITVRRASGLEELLEFLPRTFAGREAVAFNFLKERERLAAGGREPRAAAALAAARHQHERFHGLDERPGFHVGHAHVLGGFAERAGFLDQCEQFHFAGAERNFFAAHDPQPEMQRDCVGGFCRHVGSLQQAGRLQRERLGGTVFGEAEKSSPGQFRWPTMQRMNLVSTNETGAAEKSTGEFELPLAGFKGTPAEIERQWFEQVYRGRGDSMKQLTWRAVLMGSALGAVLSLTNLYIGLKSGWGMGVAITACILSYAIWTTFVKIGLVKTPMTILENNCMQSTASSAGYSTGGTLISAFAAFIVLNGHALSIPLTLAWVFFLAILGVTMAVPMKKQMINIEQLRFPSGVAAAETLRALHSHGQKGMRSEEHTSELQS